MEYEDDFIAEELIEFDVDGKIFKYKPTSAEDELNWVNEYMEIIDGKQQQNFKKITECKIRNLKEVPYTKELIQKIIGIEKEWKDLNHKEKLKFLGKLKPSTFDKIIRGINKIDSPSDEQKKT